MSSPRSADAGGQRRAAPGRAPRLDRLDRPPDPRRPRRASGRVPGRRARRRPEHRAPRRAGRTAPTGGRRSRRRRVRRSTCRATTVGGDDALAALATRDDVDLVVVATGGIVSLRPVSRPCGAGKVVATANKETLVAGGHLVMPLARGSRRGARPRRPATLREPARLAPPDRLRALGDLAVPRRRAHGRRRVADPDRIGRAVPRRRRRTSPTVTPRAGAPPPDLVDGREDHDRLRNAREQGPGGHRSALAVRCRLRRDRGRDPSAERRPLGGPLRRRLPQGPAGHPGHAHSRSSTP